MDTITEVRQRAQELYKSVDLSTYERAYDKNMTLSRYLETLDPSEKYKGEEEEGLDAFARMIRASGVVTQSNPVDGYYADDFGKLSEDPTLRALVPEFISRTWRRISNPLGQSRSASVYGSTEYGLGSIMNPWNDAAGIVGKQLTPAIPLSEIVGITTPVDGDNYRAFYLRDSDVAAGDIRLVRIGEGAEIPRVKLTGGEQNVRLHKYGRVIEVTYEALRRMPIDMVQMHISRMAIQAEKDKVAAAMDILINGDGNSGTAATVVNLSAMDADATGELTLKAWINFRMQFENPYFPTTALAQADVMLQAMLLNTGEANLPLAMLPNVVGNFAMTPINPQLADGMRVGWTTDAPANKILAFDRRISLQRLTEIGGNLSEVERWTTRQTQTLTLTEVEGYASLDSDAVKILNLSA